MSRDPNEAARVWERVTGLTAVAIHTATIWDAALTAYRREKSPENLAAMRFAHRVYMTDWRNLQRALREFVHLGITSQNLWCS